MTRLEVQILRWLSDEQRPVSHLVAMPLETLQQWIRARGGKLPHIDAAMRMRGALRLRVAVRVQDAHLDSDNVVVLKRRSHGR
jgi:hypothetical protein